MAGLDMVGQEAAAIGGQTLAYSENHPAALRLLQAEHPDALRCLDFNLGGWRFWVDALEDGKIQAMLGSMGSSCVPWTPAGPQRRKRHKQSNETADAAAAARWLDLPLFLVENVAGLLDDDPIHGA